MRAVPRRGYAPNPTPALVGPQRPTPRRRSFWAARALAGAILLITASPMAQEVDQLTPEGWRQAEAGYQLQFPRDHGNHPDYRIEWWYYTGNLVSDDGRRFGYQVTFFRIGVDFAPVNPSRWAVRDLFMAHLAVTDIEAGRHVMAERLDRGGVGWAGARPGTLDVWNGDWRADLDGDTHRVRALDHAFGVDLRLAPGHGTTAHGADGLSRKGAEAGNASFYYSMTRMPTSGHLVVDGERIRVSGASWMDHEFGTTFLEASQVGWDWFSLQLDDGSDLMVFQLRGADGEPDLSSAGTWVDAAGTASGLDAGEFKLLPGRRWSSPSSTAAYPVEWQIEVPGRAARFDISATIDAQELDTAQSTGVTYWEGAVTVRGQIGERVVGGRGYLEMTGYAGRPMSEMFR